MEERQTSAGGLRRSSRRSTGKVAKLAECGHDVMHIDYGADRDIACDICWENRETLVQRLLDVFSSVEEGVKAGASDHDAASLQLHRGRESSPFSDFKREMMAIDAREAEERRGGETGLPTRETSQHVQDRKDAIMEEPDFTEYRNVEPIVPSSPITNTTFTLESSRMPAPVSPAKRRAPEPLEFKTSRSPPSAPASPLAPESSSPETRTRSRARTPGTSVQTRSRSASISSPRKQWIWTRSARAASPVISKVAGEEQHRVGPIRNIPRTGASPPGSSPPSPVLSKATAHGQRSIMSFFRPASGAGDASTKTAPAATAEDLKKHRLQEEEQKLAEEEEKMAEEEEKLAEEEAQRIAEREEQRKRRQEETMERRGGRAGTRGIAKKTYYESSESEDE